MKKILLTLLSGIMFFTACKKDNVTDESAVRQDNADNRRSGIDINGKPLIDAIYQGFPVKVVKIDDDTYVLDGDMLLSGKQLGFSKGITTKSSPVDGGIWTGKKVYYKFNANAQQELKDRFLQATQWYTPLGYQFIDGVGPDGIFVNVRYVQGACSAHVGRSFVGQVLNYDPFDPGWSLGDMAHEIGHVLGLHHEQCRVDRDLYINVNNPNGNYSIAPSWPVGAFDYQSLMMYGSGSSMSKKDGSGWTAQETYVSNGDKMGLEYIYDENGYVEGGTYEIKNTLSNKNLDVSASSGNVSVWSDNDGNNQRWVLSYVTGGYYKILSVANAGKALDVSGSSGNAGADVGIWPYGGSDNQLWQIVPGSVAGTYQLFPKHARTKPLDTNNGGTASGTNVQLGNYSLGGRTFWKLEKVN